MWRSRPAQSPPFHPVSNGIVRKERVVRLGDCLTICRKPGVWAPSALLVGLLVLGGCEAALQKGLLDPGEMMRVSRDRLLVPVLPSLAEGLDQAAAEFA